MPEPTTSGATAKRVCIICGVDEGCRKPCCNMGDKRCFGDPEDIGSHIFKEFTVDTQP